jgi:hypothetical protein
MKKDSGDGTDLAKTDRESSRRINPFSEDILLKDYDYLSDSFWKSEQSGEARFNIFIGLITLVSGALVAWLQRKIPFRTPCYR